MTFRHRNTASTLRWIFPAVIVLGAVLTHLASEFFGMGADADAHILLSGRHAYLALIAIASAAVLVFEVRGLTKRASGVRDFKRLLSNEMATLPLGGGWQFYVLAATLQFAAGVGSAIGEGCFFCGHDVIAGVIGALATAMLLALVGRLVAARLPRIAARLAAILLPAASKSSHALRPWISFAWSPRRVFWSPQLANRPPPLLT